MTSAAPESFYVRTGEHQVLALPTTASPWGSEAQHGGPPTALLARAIQRLDTGPERILGRLTVELLGPVPVGRLSVEASVVRPGRSVELCEATLYDDERGRPVARASAWRFPGDEAGAGPEPEPLPHSPRDGDLHERPRSWSGGYLDAVEWRWIKGGVEEQGPAVVWMRPGVALLDDEETTPLQLLMACADSASGASAALDPGEWGFLNTELTVHLLRDPVGEWFCLDAETTLSTGSVGLATSSVYDERGLVARTAQALLTRRRHAPRPE